MYRIITIGFNQRSVDDSLKLLRRNSYFTEYSTDELNFLNNEVGIGWVLCSVAETPYSRTYYFKKV